MARSLKVILLIQWILGAIWTIGVLASSPTSLAGFLFFIYIYPFHLVFFSVGAWAAWRHPALSRRARWVMTLPFAFLFLPLILRLVSGGQPGEELIRAIAIATIASVFMACLIVPGRVAGLLPGALFRSRGLNLVVLLGAVIAWLIPVLLVVFAQVGIQEAVSRDSSGYAAGYLFVAVVFYLLLVAVSSLGLATWGWLGVRGGIGGAQRRLHVAQLIAGIPGFALAVPVLIWMANQYS